MSRFEHLRHKQPSALAQPRSLIVCCAPLRSQINLSRIVRAAGCSGVTRIICCGTAKVNDRIARDGADAVEVETHRTLPPVLKKLRAEGWQLIGLEQTTNSASIYDFSFPLRTALVVGNERQGLTEEVLQLLHAVVEIPVYGRPHSHNVATATAIALYEYCRQHS